MIVAFFKQRFIIAFTVFDPCCYLLLCEKCRKLGWKMSTKLLSALGLHFLSNHCFCRVHLSFCCAKISRNASTSELVVDYRQSSLADNLNAIQMHSMTRHAVYGDEDDTLADQPDEELVRKVEGGETVLHETNSGFSGFAGEKLPVDYFTNEVVHTMIRRLVLCMASAHYVLKPVSLVATYGCIASYLSLVFLLLHFGFSKFTGGDYSY